MWKQQQHFSKENKHLYILLNFQAMKSSVKHEMKQTIKVNVKENEQVNKHVMEMAFCF